MRIHGLTMLCAGLWMTQESPAANWVQTSRYTAVEARPTEAQMDPLAAVVTIEFTEPTDTVGQAIEATLKGTGYALIDALDWRAEVFALLDYPLPDVQRQLGPLQVIDVLRTLVGPGFDVSVDQLNRKIAFLPAAAPPESEVSVPVEPVQESKRRRRR